MRTPRLIEVVVILSLGLNCFILGGFAYSRFVPTPVLTQQPDRRLERVAETIGVDPVTSKPFREFRQTVVRALRQLGMQNSLLLDDISAELASASPNHEHLVALSEQAATNRRMFLDTSSAALLKFMATLNPDQRQALLELIADRTNPVGQPLRNSLGG
jgi:uncharacterized membrane protein